MTCREYQEAASAFLDGELLEGSRRSLFRHLGECDACWRFYRRIEAIHDALKISSADRGVAATPLLSRRVTIPIASMVLGAFLTFLATILVTLAVTTMESRRLTREETHEEIPAAFRPPRPGAIHGSGISLP